MSGQPQDEVGGLHNPGLGERLVDPQRQALSRMALASAQAKRSHGAAAPPGGIQQRPALALSAGWPFLQEPELECPRQSGRGAPGEERGAQGWVGERLRAGAMTARKSAGVWQSVEGAAPRRADPHHLLEETGPSREAWASCRLLQARAAARRTDENDHTSKPKVTDLPPAALP